VLEEALIKGSP